MARGFALLLPFIMIIIINFVFVCELVCFESRKCRAKKLIP